MNHRHVFVAGTFDQFHRGHQQLLSEAIRLGPKITIGITSDRYIHQYKQKPGIASFASRKSVVATWINTIYPKRDLTIIAIHDPYEPASSGDFSAIVLTQDNFRTGDEINAKRISRGIHPLVCIQIPLIMAVDHNQVSSTRIRNHEIDRMGHLYLPQSLRHALKHPLGPIITGALHPDHGHTIVSVGDVTSDTLIKQGVYPDLVIIDLYALRQPYKSYKAFAFPSKYEKQTLQSGPGFISQEAIQAIARWNNMRKPTVFVVSGEDDLLVLPVVMALSNDDLLYYGQPGEGMVQVVITPEIKHFVSDLLRQFSSTPTE